MTPGAFAASDSRVVSIALSDAGSGAGAEPGLRPEGEDTVEVSEDVADSECGDMSVRFTTITVKLSVLKFSSAYLSSRELAFSGSAMFLIKSTAFWSVQTSHRPSQAMISRWSCYCNAVSVV